MKEKLEEEVKGIFKLVTSYAVDFFGAKDIRDIQRIDKNLFRHKCHEGFYLAQDRIISNLLEIEEELKKLKKQIKECKSGKETEKFVAEESYDKLLDEEDMLSKEVLLFRRLADVMAWTILKMDKILIRSTQTGEDFHGYLLDKNIESLIDVINKTKNLDEFMLINDITLCLGSGAGDLTRVRRGGFVFCEVKDGIVNKEIFDYVKQTGNYMKEKNIEIQDKKDVENLFKNRPNHGNFINKSASIFDNKKKREQFERIYRQWERMGNVLDYHKRGIGFDIRKTKSGQETGRMKIMSEAKTADEYFFNIIEKEFQYLSTIKSDFHIINFEEFLYFLLSDNQRGTVFNIKNSRWVRNKNAQHLLFHAINKNDCKYVTAKTEKDWKDAYEKELLIYKDLFVINWAEQILRDGSLRPPYLFSFDENLIFDLLFERKSIFIHFDSDKFIEFVNSMGISFLEMERVGKITHDSTDIKFKRHKEDKHKITMGWGMIFRMMFEFQDPISFLDQIVEVYNQE
ncbi:MAG TPA: hypothetical protein VMV66_02270 [Candidatus Humimicrobiaceae bacterium]|nr:hypothetical protein [Candidatus Humimicrobiaceae bacterium]